MSRITLRKAILLGSLAAIFAAFSISDVGYAAPDYDGDGFTTDDCAPLDPAVHPGVADKPDLSFEDTNCDGIDGDLGKAIFVSKLGVQDDSGTGTKDNPLYTIDAGVIKAKAANPDKDVYVAGGTYTEIRSPSRAASASTAATRRGTAARSTDEVTIISGRASGPAREQRPRRRAPVADPAQHRGFRHQQRVRPARDRRRLRARPGRDDRAGRR